MTRVQRIIYKKSQCTYYELGSMVSDASLNFFIVFHQVYSPSPHSYFLHFNWLNCFLILLQHCNTQTIHTSTVFFYDQSFFLSARLCVHTPLCNCFIIHHTVHNWVLAPAQHLIGISAFLEPSVFVWLISRTSRKSPSLSCPFWNVPTTGPHDI
jgi:hypothetical protein